MAWGQRYGGLGGDDAISSAYNWREFTVSRAELHCWLQNNGWVSTEFRLHKSGGDGGDESESVGAGLIFIPNREPRFLRA